jgi:nucleotide-binding universal stress UspA family protein
MVPFENILVPVDFSDRSMAAAYQVETLAHHFHSKVTVLHVVDPQEQNYGHFEPGGARVHEFGTLLAGYSTRASITEIMRDGDPAQTILDFTTANHMDLIVMASHGFSPFYSFLMGSVAAEVLREANCPVWIDAHAQQGPPPRFRNILCAADFDPTGPSVVDAAAQFAAAFMARLFVVHIFPSLEPTMGLQFPDEWLSQADREAIRDIEKRLGTQDQTILAGGDVPEAICRRAKELHADLLVIGRSPKANDVGVARTTSFTIARESPCPVLSI